MVLRPDLVFEGPITLDGSGNYTGAWLDSVGVETLGTIYTLGLVGVQLDQSSDASAVIATDGWTNNTEKKVYARYFRLSVAGGTAGASVRISIRAVD